MLAHDSARLMRIPRGRFGGSKGTGTRTPGHRPKTALDAPTRRSPAVDRCPLPGLHPADSPSLRHPPRLGHPHHRPPHRRQPRTHSRTADQRPPHHLSAGLSSAQWSEPHLASQLARPVLGLIPSEQVLTLVGYATVEVIPGDSPTIRSAIGTRSVPATVIPAGDRFASGSSFSYSCGFPGPTAPGPCRSSSTCIAARRPTAGQAAPTAPRPRS